MLDQAWSSFCTESGRKEFIGSLGGYYNVRQSQMEQYPQNFGKPGAEYIAPQWTTTEDKRIDRLTQQAYSNGYLRPENFDTSAAQKLVTNVVKGERINGKGCAS